MKLLIAISLLCVACWYVGTATAAVIEGTPDKAGKRIRFTHAIYRKGEMGVVFRARTVKQVDELLKRLRG